MGPVFPAGLRVQAVDGRPAIHDVDKPITDGRSGQTVTLQREGPQFTAASNLAGLAGVDALQPGLVFTVPVIAAGRHINSPLVEDRHPRNVARTFLPVFLPAVDIVLGPGRITVEAPHAPQRLR